MEKLTFVTDDNDNVDLYIIEETRANGINYLLVSDSDDEEDGDAQCYILKDTSAAEDEEAVYEFVEDDTEFDAISRIFAELMDDGVELAEFYVLIKGFGTLMKLFFCVFITFFNFINYKKDEVLNEKRKYWIC